MSRLTPEREKDLRDALNRSKKLNPAARECLAEIDALREELIEAIDIANEVCDILDPRAKRTMQTILKERDSLREALEPFAEIARKRKLEAQDHSLWAFSFSGSQFAAARDAYDASVKEE